MIPLSQSVQGVVPPLKGLSRIWGNLNVMDISEYLQDKLNTDDMKPVPMSNLP